MASVLIVDDHPTIRMAVSLLLQHDLHTVCGEVDNGIDALKEWKKTSPDVVILDIGIPKLDGLEVIKRIKSSGSPTQIVVLSAQNSHHIMLRCLQAGASGFVSKMDELMLIKNAINACLNGQKYFPSDVISKARYTTNTNNSDILNLLSNREMSVLLALCNGVPNKDIASNMLLSEKTVSTYKTRLMHKLNVGNIVELVEFAKRNGVISV
ncbi:MAG: response regulator [Aeromonas popoffii]|uniref:response regulator transcription factor n=1 Tax=Aeromonas popoffii TaxID=70856 RepID=UPI0030D477D4